MDRPVVGGRGFTRRAASELEPLLAESETTLPAPVEVPAPVAGGTEPITKGAAPQPEHR